MSNPATSSGSSSSYSGFESSASLALGAFAQEGLAPEQQYLAVTPNILPILQSWSPIAFNNLEPRGIPVPLPPAVLLRIQGCYDRDISRQPEQSIIYGTSLEESRSTIDDVAAFVVAAWHARNTDFWNQQVKTSMKALRQEMHEENRKIGKEINTISQQVAKIRQDGHKIRKDIRKIGKDMHGLKNKVNEMKKDSSHNKKLKRWNEPTSYNYRLETYPVGDLKDYQPVPTFKIYEDKQEHASPPGILEANRQLNTMDKIKSMQVDQVDLWLSHYDIEVEDDETTIDRKRDMLLFYILGRLSYL